MMSHLPLDVQRALDAAKLAYPPPASPPRVDPPRADAPRLDSPRRAPLAAFPDRREVEGSGAFERAASQLFDRRRDAVRAAPRAEVGHPRVSEVFSPALIAALLVVFPPAGVFAVWTAERLPLQGKTAASVVAGLWTVLLAALLFAR